MLYLISIGLWDEKDMSLRALEAAKRCDQIYLERYTTNVNTTAAKLSKLIGKKVMELKRSDLEEKSGKLIRDAKAKDVAVLVGGDALSATTHVSLLLDARKAHVRAEVIHGSSIFSAVAETGLQLYKFGRATTLAKDFTQSCYDAITQNKKAGLHTLVLLDIGMDARQGLETLMKRMDVKDGIVVACHLGGVPVIRYGTLAKLTEDRKLAGMTPAVIVIPGELHFMEKEFLDSL